MHKKLTIEEHVRWSDTDRPGMMYYGQFLRFFEIAETELFRAVGLPYAEVFDRLDIHVRVCSRRDHRKPWTLSLQRHLQNMLFYHKGLQMCKKPLSLVACDRKAAILRVQIWSTH
jgi:hypothetical protein